MGLSIPVVLFCPFALFWIVIRSSELGGRQRNSKTLLPCAHSLPKKHPVTKLIVVMEYIRLLHASLTLMMSVLSQRFTLLASTSSHVSLHIIVLSAKENV